MTSPQTETTSSSTPLDRKLTAVMGTRADGYGGDQERRFIFSLAAFLPFYDEIVVVDWNSPGRETLLEKVEAFIPKTGRIKEVIVTEEDLRDLGYPLQIPISEVHFRNIGIRRATYDWVVSTNPDICPVDWLDTDLDPDTLYVTPRFDTWDFRAFQKFEASEFVDLARYRHHGWERKPYINSQQDPWSKIVCCGDFQLAHKQLWNKMRGFEESMIYRSFADTNTNKKADIYGAGVKVIDDYHICHLNHGGHTMHVQGTEVLNDQYRYIQGFQSTENSMNWGAPTFDFKTRYW